MKVVVPQLWDYEKYGPGNVVEWFKEEGEETGESDLLCQIMVVKAINNVYSGIAGTVSKIMAPIGAEVKPGDELAEITEISAEPKKEIPGRVTRIASTSTGRIRATPSARRIAREKGIDIDGIKGTGKGGTITGEDVLASGPSGYEKARVPQEEYSARALTGLRKAVSDTMMKSIAGSAQLTLHTSADVTELFALKTSMLSDSNISYNDLVCYFTLKALADHKYMNAHLVEGREIREFKNINIVSAVQTDEGLYSVVVKDAGKKDLSDLGKSIGNLVEKARSRTLSVEELTGSSFTVSNLGMVGIDHFTPIINPPEIAILGVGSISDKLELTKGGVEFRKEMGLSLTIDHRAVDGYNASLFLNRLKEILGSPREFL